MARPLPDDPRVLLAGFVVLSVMIVIAGVLGGWSMLSTSRVIRNTLDAVQEDSRLSSQFASSIAQEVAAARRFLDRRDSTAGQAFTQLGWEAHRIQRAMSSLPSQTMEEIALVAAIDATLSDIEGAIRARASAGGSRAPRGRAQASRDDGTLVARLLGDVERLGQMESAEGADAGGSLQKAMIKRAVSLALVILTALALALIGVITSVRRVTQPSIVS